MLKLDVSKIDLNDDNSIRNINKRKSVMRNNLTDFDQKEKRKGKTR